MKKLSLYGVISTISYFVRQFFVPNPFEKLNWFFATTFNWLFGLILFPISFFIVGLFYIPGECPWLGSIAYCIVYFVVDLFVLGFMTVGTIWWMWLLLAIAIIVLISLIVWRCFRQFA